MARAVALHVECLAVELLCTACGEAAILTPDGVSDWAMAHQWPVLHAITLRLNSRPPTRHSLFPPRPLRLRS